MLALVLAAGLAAATASPSPTPSVPPVIVDVHSLMSGPKFLPTPPPDVLARTKYIYEEAPTKQHWLFLHAAPEERYVKMYVTSVKRVGPIWICRGWVVRVPFEGHAGAIVDEDGTYVCAGRMRPYVHGSTPEPQATLPPD